jgi:hypothetical protein
MNVSMQNWRQMAEKLGASVCVLENLLNSTAVMTGEKNKQEIGVKAERSIALQFPEDFFQDASNSIHLVANEKQHGVSNTADNHHVQKIDIQNAKMQKTEKQTLLALEVLPESQTKLHQSIINFKQFNCSLKPLLAMLEFVLQDASGLLF